MRQRKIWINGKFSDLDKAVISVFDRGFLYGDGAFETMRSYAGVVFKIEEHMERLFGALEALRIRVPYTEEHLIDIVYRLLKANGLKGAYVRLTVTRGEGRFGLEFNSRFRPNIVITTRAFAGYPEEMYVGGISAKCVDATRQNAHSPLANIKSLNYLNHILARLDAKAENFDEAILLNTEGCVAEAAASNIFLVKQEALITPSADSGILPGITRAFVIEIARKLRIPVREKEVEYRDLIRSDEVFLTNSLMEVVPVVEIDSKRIGNGAPGEMTKLLHISYQKEVIKKALI